MVAPLAGQDLGSGNGHKGILFEPAAFEPPQPLFGDDRAGGARPEPGTERPAERWTSRYEGTDYANAQDGATAPDATASAATADHGPAGRGRATYQPPTYQPPTHDPLSYEPPTTHDQPTYEHYGPSAYLPPAYEPPAYEPPAYEPPAYEPPAYEPPAYEPPAYEAPKYGPPATVDGSPAYDPPAYDPPAYDALAFDPPAPNPAQYDPLFGPAPSYDVGPYQPAAGADRESTGGPADRGEDWRHAAEPLLPQRIPAEPDVPDVPFSASDPLRQVSSDPVADRVELSRIARYLHDKVGRPGERREDLDVDAIRAAVCTVPGVRDARVRHHPSGVPRLRIELADDADAGEVTRAVTRLLKERMGLAAAPSSGGHGDSSESIVDQMSARGPRLQRPYVTAPQRRTRSAGSEPARIVLDHVQVTTLGTDATVEVRLAGTSGGYAVGRSQGPCVDGYLIRLAACSAADAVDKLLADGAPEGPPARCLVEHVAVVPFGVCEVAVVVVLLARGGVAEQLSGSAIVNGDPRQAVVRATLSAVNRRLDALLP